MCMLITYDNIIFSLQKAGGISVYWSELLKRIDQQQGFICYESKNHNLFRNTFELQTQTESHFHPRAIRYLPFLKRLPQQSIFHSSYYRFSLQRNIANITTVHDFTYEYFRRGLARYVHTSQKYLAIKHSDGIICVSENTKNDLLKFFPSTDPKQIKVIYNGVGEEFQVLDNSEDKLKKNFPSLRANAYILFVGDRSEYKNFNLVAEFVKDCPDYQLIAVGGKEFNNAELRGLAPLKFRFFHFSGLSNKLLNILYNNAFCLLYPSSYEGFGIPPAEAMKAGCPVISSSSSSIPEVVDTAGLLLSEFTTKAIAKQMKYLQNKENRDWIIKQGLKQVKKFSWDKCARETFEFYDEIYHRKFDSPTSSNRKFQNVIK